MSSIPHAFSTFLQNPTQSVFMPGTDLHNIEVRLTRRLQAGDSTALAEVLRMIGEPTKGRLISRFRPLLTLDDADDAVAEASFRLWKYRGRLDLDRSSLGTWFYTLARSSAIDTLRKLKRYQSLQRELSELTAGNPSVTTDEQASRNDVLAGQILELLSPLDQRILQAFADHSEERWAADLAAEIGIDSGTLRTRKLRLVRRLRKKYSHIVALVPQRAEDKSMVPYRTHDVETLPRTPSSLLDEFHDELREIGRRIGEIVAAQNRNVPEDLVTVHSRLWDQAIADDSINSPERHRFLTTLWSWSHKIEDAKQAQWHRLQLVLSEFIRPINDESVNRFERVLVTLSQEIRSLVPPELLSAPTITLSIHWTEQNCPITVNRGDRLGMFSSILKAAIAMRWPEHREGGLEQFIARKVRQQTLAIPALAPDTNRSTSEKLFLIWNLKRRDPSSEPPPSRDTRLQIPEIPTPLELELWSQFPDLAEHLDRAICLAAILDASNSIEARGEESQSSALTALANHLSEVTRRPPVEIEEFIMNFIAYGRRTDTDIAVPRHQDSHLGKRAAEVVAKVLQRGQ